MYKKFICPHNIKRPISFSFLKCIHGCIHGLSWKNSNRVPAGVAYLERQKNKHILF